MKKLVSWCLVCFLLMQMVPVSFAAEEPKPISVYIESGIKTVTISGKDIDITLPKPEELKYQSLSAVLRDLADGKLTSKSGGVDVTYTFSEGCPCLILIDGKNYKQAYIETIDSKVIFSSGETAKQAEDLSLIHISAKLPLHRGIWKGSKPPAE